MNREDFKEQLLQVMERKDHWAWPAFGDGTVPKDRLHMHFEQEYEVYVRDFPVLLGRAYVQCPVAAVRRELAENLYEEETGGLSGGTPHPELFLRYPEGLGMDLGRFEQVELLPAARRYRALLDRLTEQAGWEVAAAVTTLFLEGTKFERGEVEEGAKKRPEKPLEEHPLVRHYGLPLENLALTKAHRQVEGSHRRAAWSVMLCHIQEGERSPVIGAMEAALEAWLAYRDEVAEACGLKKDADGRPVLSPAA
ncbi:MAG: iron-containing redox enzyme family protein [Myxococcota bacterium]